MKTNRFPFTKNKSLQAWNAADELIVSYHKEKDNNLQAAIINDRFGYLSCHLNNLKPICIIDFKSQKLAIEYNLKENDFIISEDDFVNPLSAFPNKVKQAIIKIPKSMELYSLYLEQICENSDDDIEVTAGFMTKYFNKQMIEIAKEYFEEVEQSKAKKKARLIFMKGKKAITKHELINKVKINEKLYLKQYYGVFASSKIDVATRYLLENIHVNKAELQIMDLASGNGVIANHINELYKSKNWELPQLHLVDDSFLAIESSKLNFEGDNIHFYQDANMESISEESMDMIISNPPFHFEHEENTEISLNLFRKSILVLKTGGRMIVVYNRHLNYIPFLKSIFSNTKIVAESNRFVVVECWK
ncbi:MAG: hypothetical protein DRI86_15835 [Bacteroidetes bacterium]|nr:MAG: hypothetical protein DRI86_15835 [Bacteroidota bacterium]